jgi:16S rRNA (guanine527-N7)-methyltransferase
MTSSEPYLPDWLNVSRETFGDMVKYKTMVEKWSPTINLVSKADLATLWLRHILDSAQIAKFCPADAVKWCDLGSGGGFPGIVVAIMAKELYPDLRVTLVEADLRKAVFLREVVRLLGLTAIVEAKRLEDLEPQEADVISARALSDLDRLLAAATRHLAPSGQCVFPKGGLVSEELRSAQERWAFSLQTHASLTAKDAKILVLKDITHV